MQSPHGDGWVGATMDEIKEIVISLITYPRRGGQQSTQRRQTSDQIGDPIPFAAAALARWAENTLR